MNHTVPEWDSAGRDLDVIWSSSESASPSKSKWEGRRSDLAFVPDYNSFEELCYEDGRLLVMQCLGSKGNFKNRNYSAQFTPVDVASAQSGLPVVCVDGTFEIPNSTHSIYSSTMNFNSSQEDELLSWIKFSMDEQEVLTGGQSLTTPCERLCSSGITNYASQRNVEEPVMPTAIMQKTMWNDGDTCINESVSTRDSTPKQTSKAQLETSSTVSIRMDMPSTQLHPATMGTTSSASANGLASSMNFSNFARPAATFKASLHSIGIASGPSGAERLKQLDRVGVDALKMESIDSLKKHLPCSTEEVPSQIVPIAPDDANASGVQSDVIYPPSSSKTNEDGPTNGNSEIMVNSNSSVITSTGFRATQSTDVVGIVEPSDSFSSFGSEDINAYENRTSGRRKLCDEDPEIQSEAVENQSAFKKHAAGIEDDITKRRRIAESHNQSERRRRDRISEKMKALQSLIPNSHKTDKASMLEEAIVYIKTLKAQVQMMTSTGYFVSPMLLPQGMHHLQMTAWPPVAMDLSGNTGMVGMPRVNMGVNSSTRRQFPPLLPIPCGSVPSVNAAPQTNIGLTHAAHPVLKPAVISPAYQVLVPAPPAAVPVPTPKGVRASRKTQEPVQVLPPAGYGNGFAPSHQYPYPPTFITCGGVMQK